MVFVSNTALSKSNGGGFGKVLNIVLNNAIYILIFVSVIAIQSINPNFLRIPSIVNIVSQTAAYLPVALGVAGCVVLTGTDLSAGRMIGLSACISASLLQSLTNPNKMWVNIGVLPVPLVVVMVMLMGAMFGAFNGFFVSKFKLHPFIVTLGTQMILYTLLLVYVQMGNNKGSAIAGLDRSYSNFVTGSLFKIGTTPVPNYIWISLVSCVVMWFIWNKTTLGKNMFALGSNEEAARVSGVNVMLTNVLVFAMAGAYYGLSGFIEGARVNSNTQSTGLNYELDAIAACVIGGVSFVGGIGKISGVVVGVFLLRLIFVGLTMVRVDQNYFSLIKGIIILVAVALDMRKYRVNK